MRRLAGGEDMREHTDGYSRRELLCGGVAVAGLGLAGCLGGSPDDTGSGSGSDPTAGDTAGTDATTTNGDGGNDAWRTSELTNVLTDETFTIGALEPPVLVETFAVWCPTCTRQQREVGALLDRREDVTAVSLNVDPNEDARKVREHAESEGFDWPAAVAPPEVTTSLKNAFGTTVLNPPSAPIVRVCGGSATLLGTGVKSADELADSIEDC
jgi:hypothetical protein